MNLIKNVALFFIVFIVACKKDSLVSNPDYVGFWQSDASCTDYIRISAEGSCEYWVVGGSECGGGSSSHEEDNVRTNGKNFKIDHVKFKIITPPTNIDTLIKTCGYCGFEVYVTRYMELKKDIFNSSDQAKYYKMGMKVQ